MNYTHLTQEERYQIRAMLTAQCSLNAIAEVLGRSRSTISREVRRNRGQRGYRPKQAHQKARERAVACRRRVRISPEQWREVERLLRLDWSPEEITGRLRLEGMSRISPEWIYQYVYADKALGGDLHTHLRCQKKRRKRYGSGVERRGQIAGRVTDASGAVIPNANVSVTETATGVSRRSLTNAEGIYTIPYLSPGTYRVEIGAGIRSRAGARARRAAEDKYSLESVIAQYVRLVEQCRQVRSALAQRHSGLFEDGPDSVVHAAFIREIEGEGTGEEAVSRHAHGINI